MATEVEVAQVKSTAVKEEDKQKIKAHLNSLIKTMLMCVWNAPAANIKDKPPRILQADKGGELIKVSSLVNIVKALKEQHKVSDELLPTSPAAGDTPRDYQLRNQLRRFMQAFRQSHDNPPVGGSQTLGSANRGSGAGSQQQCTPS